MKKWMLGFILGLSIVSATYAAEKDNAAAGVTFDAQGQLWRATVKQGQVWVDHSQPLFAGGAAGSTPQFSAAVAVSPQADATGESQPGIAVGDGKVWVAWSAAQAVYLSVSNDNGATFSAARKVADSGSACSSIALQPAPDNHVVILWRQAFDGGARDYAMAKLDMQTPIKIHRATFGGSPIDACPQPSPALARGGDWGWHMAWYAGGEKPGIFYARMDGDAWVSSPAKRFGDQHSGQSSLLAIGEHVWLAWEDLNAKSAAINIAASDDGGRSWPEPILAGIEGGADEPVLFNHDEQAYLLWNTVTGLRLLPLP